MSIGGVVVSVWAFVVRVWDDRFDQNRHMVVGLNASPIALVDLRGVVRSCSLDDSSNWFDHTHPDILTSSIPPHLKPNRQAGRPMLSAAAAAPRAGGAAALLVGRRLRASSRAAAVSQQPQQQQACGYYCPAGEGQRWRRRRPRQIGLEDDDGGTMLMAAAAAARAKGGGGVRGFSSSRSAGAPRVYTMGEVRAYI